MQYVNELSEYKDSRRTAVTFGKFDGLHMGHQKLIKKVQELQKEKGVLSVVCAFDMSPLLVSKGIRPQGLITSSQRQRHLEDEVDYLVECPFTERFSQVSAEDFIRDIIAGLFHAAYVVVGTDFRFGHEKRGDVEMLSQYARQYGYELIVIEKERYEGTIISSTYIKDVLRKGNIELAAKLLGYPYEVEGIVEHGKQLGRTLGFPTANVLWPENKIVPPRGVYFNRICVDGIWYNGIGNVGVKPTVANDNCIRIESFLFGYEGDAYGKQVAIEFLSYQRSEQKFASIDEMKECIDRDIRSARNYFGIDE